MRFNSVLEDVKVYETGKPIELVVRDFGIRNEDIIKLASNENPHGVSPNVIKSIQDNAYKAFLYPDDSAHELKEEMASFYNIKKEELLIGAGSDQIIEFAVHAKLNKNSTVLMNKVTFAMYEIYTKHIGAKIVKTDSIEHDLDQFYDLYKKENPDIIFLCVPNNPTGDALDQKDIYNFLEKIDKETMVIIDGAYMEYASFKDKNKKINPNDLIKRFSNVLYLGTFSKAYGLGGMRIGYGIANKNIITNLSKIRPPFNITILSIQSALVALRDQDFIQNSVKDCFVQMKEYENFLKTLGLDYIPSYTNFIMIKMGKYSSKIIADSLLKKGIIVRDLSSYGLNAIRVTIGTDAQNKIFFKSFKGLFSL